MRRLFFKTDRGEKVDIIQYSLEMFKKQPSTEIYIGSDSQNFRKSTVYVGIIAYRYGQRGVHFVYYKERVKKIKDKFTRLWKEVELTAEIGQLLRSNLVPVHVAEVDFNKKETTGSHMMLNTGVGYLRGLGYDTVVAKPDSQIAVKAADHLLRH